VATYDDQDRLLSYVGKQYEYNFNGELTAKILSDGSSFQYDYDVFGTLLSVGRADRTTIEYLVDAQQRSVGKRVSGTLTHGYLYQDQLNPVAELDGAGNVVSRFVYGEKNNVPDYVFRGSKNYRIISDHLGSVRLVVNLDDGSVVQRMDYDVWGRVTQDTNPGFLES